MILQEEESGTENKLENEQENELASLLTLNQIPDLHPNMHSDLPVEDIHLPTDLELSMLPSRSRGRYEEVLNDLANFIELGEQEFGPVDDSDNQDVVVPQAPDEQDLDYALIHQDDRRDYPYHIHSPRLRDGITQELMAPSSELYDSNSNYITDAQFIKRSKTENQRLLLINLLNSLRYDGSNLNKGQRMYPDWEP